MDFFSNLSASLDALAVSFSSTATLLAAPTTTQRFTAIFAKDSWNNIMNVVRIVLTLGGAILLMYEARALRLGERIPERLRRNVAIVLAVLAFGSYFDFGNPNTRYSEFYHRHEFYHYYLGAKYFQELEYTRLYECTMVAEVENGRRSQVARREIRDLRVNLIKPVKDTYILDRPEECKKHFSPEKWTAFKKDVAWFEESARGAYWEGMQKDHGYNPPPVWTMGGKIFASFAPAGDTFFKILSSVDVLLHIGIVAMLFWAFGWRVGATATIFWGCNGPANFYWTGGAFLRQDWFFFLVAALCLSKKNKHALAGAALTWSALLRVFPLIMFAGWGIVILLHLIRHRRFHPKHLKLIGGCVVAAGLLVPASMVATGGPNSYASFVEHIKVHKDTPLTNHMGLETMIVHDWNGRMHFTRNEALDDPFAEWKSGRTNRFKEAKPLFFGIVLALGAWTVWALRRSKHLWLALPLSLPLTMSLTNLTCYYYSMFIVAAGVLAARPSLGPAMLAASAASQVILRRFYFFDDKFAAMSWLFFAFSLLILFVMSRPFSIGRLMSWFKGKPDLPARSPAAPVPAE